MGEAIYFPTKKSYISKLIDALLDIRLTLSFEKINNGNFIKRGKLKEIIDKTKSEFENSVGRAIDDVFKEYFEPKNVIEHQSNEYEGQSNEYQDQSNEKGMSYVKSDGHHKSEAYEPKISNENKAA